ncbi:hypothetical protein Ahy_A02g008194 [Arachis hypogaea]|uniref:Aminotransferase-like plant mobile domain-containing protein n=1 Tax=Arachis hypogaea TaxID=3818 RepID=A0A445EDX6_ARAHY|nr:hypothetical protein Ahy_A02g008194 [Arachis hypogaea]
MIGLSLLDVATITGLLVSFPELTYEVQPNRDYRIVHRTYNNFIAQNMGKENELVTDDEHVIFLYYWLNAIVFCFRSIQSRLRTISGLLFSLFHSCKNFNNNDLNFTPFLHRNCGPSWPKLFLFPNDDQEDEIANRNWVNLLDVQIISTGLP